MERFPGRVCRQRSNGRWFDLTFEERLKARQQTGGTQKSGSEQEKAQTDGDDWRRGTSDQHANGSADMSAPVSRREAVKRRRKATQPQKSVSSSARGQSAFPTEKVLEENPSVNA